MNRTEPTLLAAMDYGSEHPDECGGVTWARDPVRVVFFATAHVDGHRRALQGLVEHPDRVEVCRCRHTERQLHSWLTELTQQLRGGRCDELRITGWGMHTTEEDFGIFVAMWPWSDEAAERARIELAPIPAQFEALPPGVNLGGPYGSAVSSTRRG